MKKFTVRRVVDSNHRWTVANGEDFASTHRYIDQKGEEVVLLTSFPSRVKAEEALAKYEAKQKPAEKSEDRTKPSNPKYALGVKKVPMHVVPCGPLLEVALAFMEGGRKYGTHNYRDVGVRASTYYNAVLRHLMGWWEGEDIDPDSGVHHVTKAIACLFVVRDSMLMNNMTDDRPIRYPDGLPMDEINKIVEGIIEKYPDCKAPYTQIKEKADRTKPAPGGY